MEQTLIVVFSLARSHGQNFNNSPAVSSASGAFEEVLRPFAGHLTVNQADLRIFGLSLKNLYVFPD